MPGVTVAEAQLVSDPARRELDMVFTFEHMGLDQAPGGTKWDLAPLHLPDLKANLTAWQEGLADVGWGSLYWDNHDQPRIVSRWGDDGEHRVASAKTLGSVLHLLRGTPYVYQGEELGMTNAHLTSLDGYRDIESLNWAREAVARGVAEADVLALARREVPRQRAYAGAVGRRGRRPGSRPARRGWRSTRTHVEINAEAALADPGSVFHHYRRLIEARHTLPVVVDGRLPAAAARPTSRSSPTSARSAATTLLLLANLSGAPADVDLGEDAGLLDGEVLLATHDRSSSAPGPVTLEPWESFAVLRG